MTILTYVTLISVALLGQALQIVLKWVALKKKYSLTDAPKYSLIQYLKEDVGTQLGGLIFTFIVIICVDELLNWQDWVANYLKFVFSFVGFAGAELATKVYSVANDKANALLSNSTPK